MPNHAQSGSAQTVHRTYPIEMAKAELVDEILEPEDFVEGLPELLGHQAEEDKVDGAVEERHDVHHLTQLHEIAFS